MISLCKINDNVLRILGKLQKKRFSVNDHVMYEVYASEIREWLNECDQIVNSKEYYED